MTIRVTCQSSFSLLFLSIKENNIELTYNCICMMSFMLKDQGNKERQEEPKFRGFIFFKHLKIKKNYTSFVKKHISRITKGQKRAIQKDKEQPYMYFNNLAHQLPLVNFPKGTQLSRFRGIIARTVLYQNGEGRQQTRKSLRRGKNACRQGNVLEHETCT